MPGASDPDAKLIVFALKLAYGQDIEQLRMERPAEKVQHPFRDARSDKQRIHGITSDLLHGDYSNVIIDCHRSSLQQDKSKKKALTSDGGLIFRASSPISAPPP